MGTSAWSTQQLAEFVAVVSAAASETSAALAAVERAAEAFDADVAAIVGAGALVAAVGYPEGRAPVDELARVRPGVAGSSLDVPGVGACVAAAAVLEHPPGATLVVARPGPLSREETGLLRGMASVASMTMRLLRVLDDERAARDELERLAREQAALRRVATLVAEAASPDAIFAAVAEEVGRLLSADRTFMGQYESDDTVTVVAAWSATGDGDAVGIRRRVVPGQGVSGIVRETGRPARDDRSGEGSGPLGIGFLVAAPITVGGRLWGLISVTSSGDEPPPPGTEERLADFTELAATAIANAEAQSELTASRARIVTTADETRRRIERDLHDGAQQRLVSLALQLRAAQAAVPPGLDELAAELEQVSTGLDGALDELHELARGIHPAILSEGGLQPALRALVRRSAVPVDLHLRAEGRLPEPVEVAAYYIVTEALTNAAKHAQATSVTVDVDVDVDDDVLRLRVRDDGVGGAELARGSGLVGLRDRVDALGGRLELRSVPAHGTSLRVELPLPGSPAAASSA